MKNFDTLYTRTLNNQIQEWSISVQQTGMTAQITISEGLLTGKKSIKTENIKAGKNIGKANATDPYQQAINEAQGRWNKKQRQGYKSLDNLGFKKGTNFPISDLPRWLNEYLPKDSTDKDGNLKPMKCQKYFKPNGDVCIKFPAIGQPKINGFRCVARLEEVQDGLFTSKRVVFRSKEGLEYTCLEHIAKDLPERLFSFNYQEIVFDGEMYYHGALLEDISSAVRKRNNNTGKLRFHIFDLSIPGYNQQERLDILDKIFPKVSKLFSDELNFVTAHINIGRVNDYVINSNEEAQSFADLCIKAGYEGAVFRDPKALYQFGKRPQTMAKLKRHIDKEYPIVDVLPMEKDETLGIFVCRTEKGKTFKVTPEGSREVKNNYLINKAKFIGKMLTVKFFEYTEDEKPFHATGITVRDYE